VDDPLIEAPYLCYTIYRRTANAQGAKHAQPISWQIWILILKNNPFGLMFVNV